MIEWENRAKNATLFSLRSAGEQSVALDRAGITVFRDITFLAAGPASERSRSGLNGSQMYKTPLTGGICTSALRWSWRPLQAFQQLLHGDRPPPLAAGRGAVLELVE